MNVEIENGILSVRYQINSVQVWDRLGIDKSERFSRIEKLKNEISEIVTRFASAQENQLRSTMENIEKVKSIHRKAMIAFGLSENEIINSKPDIEKSPLISQLDVLTQDYESFKLICSDRIQKMEKLIIILRGLFDTLEIPHNDRGEFETLGDSDLTRERLERFKFKVAELQTEITKRKTSVDLLKKDIQILQEELEEKLTTEENNILSSDKYSTRIIEANQLMLQRLQSVKKDRVYKISQLAIEITHLWDLLKISDNERTLFLSKHSTISENVLHECREELKRLSIMRNEMLPKLIESQISEINSLWSKLHIAPESRIRIDEYEISPEESIERFSVLEKEIVRLKKLSVDLHPLISLINQREEIVENYECVMKATSDPRRLTSRERGCAQQLMLEEKARRRYKVTLPKLEKKLAQVLKEYKNTNGNDFEWDGTPYIEKISNVPSESIKNRAKNANKSNTLPMSPRKKVIRNENLANN